MGLSDVFKKGTLSGFLLDELGFFDSQTDNISQVPLTTPEQDKARKMLLDLAQTGDVGGLTGDADLSGFNFNISPTETAGQSRLMQLLTSSPQGIDTARNTLTDFATSEFDLDDPENAFAAFRRQLSRGIQDADDVLNREAAITGDRFGSRILGEKGDLAARQSDILSQRLGEQFGAQQDRKLRAAGALGDLGGLEQQLQQSKIAQAFQLGGLQRDLQNQQAQLKLNDFLRQRNERIGAITSLTSNTVPFGIKDIESKTPSPFTSLLNAALPAVGTAIGGPIGGAIGSGIGGLFNQSQNQLSLGSRSFGGGSDGLFATTF